MLDNTLRADGVFTELKDDEICDLKEDTSACQTRYSIRTRQLEADLTYKYEVPDAYSLFQLTRAWNIKNVLYEYHQPCTYILSALLLVTKSPDLAY